MIRIERAALTLSSIQSISIPSKLVDLEDGWSFETSRLHKIQVSDKKPLYIKLNDKMVIENPPLNLKITTFLYFVQEMLKK